MPFAQNKATLCWPNHIDRCTVSSEDDFTLPLTNVQTRVLKQRARTSELEPTIEIELDAARPIGVVCIAAHNLSAAAAWRVMMYDGSDALLEDSGDLPVWPSVFENIELNWEDDNFWTGTPAEEDRTRFTPLATWFADKAWLTSRIVISLTDPSNPDAFIEFGRVFIADVFQPRINLSYGVQFNYIDPTEIESALDTTEYFDLRAQRRTATMAFEYLEQDEAFARMYRMRRDLGISGELLFAYRLMPDSTLIQRTMLARLSQPDPLTHPNALRYAHAISLLEIL